MKNVKILLLLGVMLVNVMPYFNNGKVEWKAAQAEAQFYTIEDYGDGWFQCGDHSDPAVNFDYYERCELLNMISPPPIEEISCVNVENAMRWNGAIRGYDGNTYGGNMCGLLVLGSIIGADPYFLKSVYCQLFLFPPIDEKNFTGTHDEAGFYSSFGVSIGSSLTKENIDQCTFAKRLADRGNNVGIFIKAGDHVSVIYKLTYDKAIDEGSAWYYSTMNSSWDDVFLRSNAMNFPGEFHVIF